MFKKSPRQALVGVKILLPKKLDFRGEKSDFFKAKNSNFSKKSVFRTTTHKQMIEKLIKD